MEQKMSDMLRSVLRQIGDFNPGQDPEFNGIKVGIEAAVSMALADTLSREEQQRRNERDEQTN